ncbi:uncharacterized protein LOC141617046 [Silene latifolia]|uniref:uncharacterized protein LOC141617046 n=1 Tax=Silene latifolia TaxID=37657 RepID=UPI003D78B2EB
MDRSWMYRQRDFEYLERLDEFITQAVKHQRRNGDDEQLMCPCSVCKNRKKVNSGSEMREHLILKGFKPNYTVWIWYGDKENGIPNGIMADLKVIGEDCNNNEVNEHSDDKESNIEADNVDQMMGDLEKDFVDCPKIFQMLISDSKKPLFSGCSKFTRLSAVMKLYTIKAGNGRSDKSFTALLKLLSNMLPEGNELPTNTYRCKKVLCPLATNYQKIHACPRDCILYRKDYNDLDECPRCKKSRYKLKEGRKKRAIIPWFKHLFANPKDAEYMLLHDKERKKDGKLRHVADAPQWRTIYRDFPEFGSEPRNLRLGLCTDGINPFGTQSTQHSTWPIMLIIYNLPPGLTTKSKYILLTMLISGPKQPGNDIDVYLEPLIEDLKMLWNVGVKVFDAASGSRYQMHDMLCHRRGLDPGHPYRKRKKAFYGKTEHRSAPLVLSGKEYHAWVRNISTDFGKPYKPPPNGVYHIKKSIFWDLPYWEHLLVRHCIDVMYVEKNVFDTIIGTLMNMPNNT